MGLLDWLRQHLGGTECTQFVHYDGVRLKMGKIEGTVGPVDITLGGFEVHREVLQMATVELQAMDAYQLRMCQLYRSEGKGSMKNWYKQQMAIGTTLLTALQFALFSFQADPSGEADNLKSVTRRVMGALLGATGKPIPYPSSEGRKTETPSTGMVEYLTTPGTLSHMWEVEKGWTMGHDTSKAAGLPEPDDEILKVVGVNRKEWTSLVSQP